MRRNKATFSTGSQTGTADRESTTEANNKADLKTMDQVGLAFRKSALNALNQD